MARSIHGLRGVAALADDAKPGSQLGKNIRVPANIGFDTNVSKDGQAATIIFDNLWTEVSSTVEGAIGTTVNQTTNQPKVCTVNFPYSTSQRSVTMTLDIRGYASVAPGASLHLVACAGDATKVVNLTPEKGKAVKLKGKSKEAFAAKQASQPLSDFEKRLKFTLRTRAANPVCQITLFLLAEHDTDAAGSGGALLVVDSMDLQVN